MSQQITIERRKAVEHLLQNRDNMLVVCGLGSSTYDVYAAGDHHANFYLWGAMGGAVMIGLGLAIAEPDRHVMVVTGDGEALMGVGALATVAAQNQTISALPFWIMDILAKPACRKAILHLVLTLPKLRLAAALSDARPFMTMLALTHLSTNRMTRQARVWQWLR